MMMYQSTFKNIVQLLHNECDKLTNCLEGVVLSANMPLQNVDKSSRCV